MKLLFVCSGNTCRSPMAAAFVNSLHPDGVSADSAGFGLPGDEANPTAVEVMRDIGVDLSAHRSKTVTPYRIDEADHILCMSRQHEGLLLGMGTAPERLTVLDVPDPFGHGREVYAACRDVLIGKVCAFLGIRPTVTCRRAAETDFSFLAAVEQACFSQPWSRTALEQFAANGGRLYVAEQNGTPVGYAGVSAVAGEGYITNVAVVPTARRQGVGRALLTAMIKDAVAEQQEFLSLEVREGNRAALGLYTAFGFVPEGRRKRYYTAPDEDALILTRRFRYDHFEY